MKKIQQGTYQSRNVKTKNGEIEGVCREEYDLFMGIPYAKPPVGELRWRAPEKVEPWHGILHADHFAAKSMQQGGCDTFYDKEFYQNREYEVPISEDSLFLNIWTPDKQHKVGLPVAFWIHGGAFMGGFGSEMEFDGEAFCKKGVILVTINYRLNIYGFLAHPWLSEENDKKISGNYGILDQIMALEWVYENIEAFGGDKDNITIMGQSAGAMSVQTLLSTELTGNRISKAVMQSGGSYGTGLHRDMSLIDAMNYGKKFVAETGAKNVQELRQMSTKELNLAMDRFMNRMMREGEGLVFIPNIDGYVLKEGYYEAIEKKHLKNIPYLLGSNMQDIMTTEEEIMNNKPGMLYEGSLEFAKKLDENGQKSVYVYYFTRQLSGDQAGAFHSAELWYMFGTLDRCWRPMEEADRLLSKKMVSYWTNFIKNGDPNGDEVRGWNPCCKDDYFIMKLDV